MRGDVARAAPEVGDGLPAVGLDVLGERGQHRASQRLLREQCFHEFRVVARDGVVELPGGGQVGRFSHTARPYCRPTGSASDCKLPPHRAANRELMTLLNSAR